MITISQYSTRIARASARRALLQFTLAAACLLAGSATAGAQPVAGGRAWAAQTGINQVTLAWDSVPGTAEYRVYLDDPNSPGTLSARPVVVLSGSGRQAFLTGVQRAANGMTLVAVAAGGRELRRRRFNRVSPATFFPKATPPTGVTAQATSASQVVVTWDSIPGATGYVIGRSVHRSGFRMLCAVCPNEAQFVDSNVAAGLAHTYTVAAIFPSGDVSTRTSSSPVTPGATQVATAPVVTSPAVPTGTVPTGTVPTSSTSAATPPGVPAGSLPTSTSGYTPPGQPAATMPTATTSTSTGTITHPPTSPATSTTTSSSGTSVPGTATAAVAACQLEYQRADNMWAPFGVPKGSLGTETIGLMVGQKKVFDTDWKYEKVRNDGTSYYGSHLRIATNRSGQTIRLKLWGYVVDLAGWNLRPFSVSLAPNTSKQFQDDLAEVECQ